MSYIRDLTVYGLPRLLSCKLFLSHYISYVLLQLTFWKLPGSYSIYLTCDYFTGIRQSNKCLCASEAVLRNIGKYYAWSHRKYDVIQTKQIITNACAQFTRNIVYQCILMPRTVSPIWRVPWVSCVVVLFVLEIKRGLRTISLDVKLHGNSFEEPETFSRIFKGLLRHTADNNNSHILLMCAVNRRQFVMKIRVGEIK